MIKGKCHCGNVTYQHSADAQYQFVCQCIDCQKLSAGCQLAAAVFPKEGFQLEGEVQTYEYPGGSGKPIMMSFCPKCGTSLYAVPTAFDKVVIRAGTYDNPEDFKPVKVIHPDEQQHWQRGFEI